MAHQSAARVYTLPPMRRELIITLADQERAVTVEPQPEGRWRVVMDGREHLVDARRVRAGTWSLLVEGRSYVVDLDQGKRGMAVLAGDAEAVVSIEDGWRRRLARAVGRNDAGAAQGEVIRAPIAGKVIGIQVSPGDVVEAGQSVGVLEAMKMESEIKSERGGTVETIHVQAGQSVDTNDPLVTLS